MQKLEMLIKSIDAHYDNDHGKFFYFMSCSLLNIARGRCDLIIGDEDTDLTNLITIQSKRAVMSGSINVKNNLLNIIPTQFSNKNERPSKIELIINKKLLINKNGILFVEKEIVTEISNYKFFIPII